MKMELHVLKRFGSQIDGSQLWELKLEQIILKTTVHISAHMSTVFKMALEKKRRESINCDSGTMQSYVLVNNII